MYRLFFTALFLTYFFVTSVSAQEGNITFEQDAKIEQLLALKKRLNETDDSEKRYRIQIYNGSLDGAYGASGSFKENYPDWVCDIRFETPNYKVWAGKFRTRLEAERFLMTVKTDFPNAFWLIPK